MDIEVVIGTEVCMGTEVGEWLRGMGHRQRF